MNTPVRRYDFSERLADILGLARRDLRVRVTLLISGGLIPPGPRGPGAPAATPAYAADLLLGVMAAPLQVHTVEAVRCYRALVPTLIAPGQGATGLLLGPPGDRRPRPGGRLPTLPGGGGAPVELPLPPGRPSLGEALTRLLAEASAEASGGAAGGGRRLARELFGLWLCRDCPVAILQFANRAAGPHGLLGQRYELAPGARPPAWLDPGQGGPAAPGLLHSVFLPIGKLIAIGRLLSLPDDERIPPMLDLGPKIASLANLAQLARDTRNRRPWQRFLTTAADSEDEADHERDSGPLVEVADFGANPGNLRMLTYVPDDLPPSAGLVVVLHGCTQTARSYDRGTGWSTLADRHGFAVLYPEQRRANNPLRCFNWFRAEDHVRDGGEAESIRAMVATMIAGHGIDPKRVFVTGLSAGGAMTSVLLATHPDVFAGGAILSAVPYRAAQGLQEAFDVIFQGKSLPAEEWAAKVHAASPHQGPWPRVQVWHGDADATVKPINQAEIIKQWAAVHGLPAAPTDDQTIDGHRHRIWRNEAGEPLLEAYGIAGMGHGAAIDPKAADGCGRVQPFIVDAGISSTGRIAAAWGLTEVTRTVKPRPKPAARPAPAAAEGGRPAGTAVPVIQLGDRSQRRRSAGEQRAGEQRWGDQRSGEQRWGEQQTGEQRAAAGAGGLDVLGIITRSFEAAGLLDGDSRAHRGASAAPLGIDIPGILATSFEAAGLLRRRRGGGDEAAVRPMKDVTPPPAAKPAPAASSPAAAEAETEPQPQPQPQPPVAAAEETDPQPAAAEPGPTAAPSPPRTRSLTEAGLVTALPAAAAVAAEAAADDGWQIIGGDPGRSGEGRVLFGHASSGLGGDLGRRVKSVACRLGLGAAPSLRYSRRLDLAAAANPFTTAAFTVLVDGVAVDEVAATGIDYGEDDWTERAGIDLATFAGRTVAIVFEVEANANVPVEVAAKAWVRDIVVSDATVAAGDAAAGDPGATQAGGG